MLAYRKQMKEMEEKIRLQEEEMEQMKQKTAEELNRKLAEGEVRVLCGISVLMRRHFDMCDYSYYYS